jgi:hypothetical protein
MALGPTQLLTQKGPSKLPGGKRRQANNADLTRRIWVDFLVASQPYGRRRPLTGIALLPFIDDCHAICLRKADRKVNWDERSRSHSSF